MSTGYERNEAVIRRFHDATNSGNLEQIFRTIDELVEPGALIRTPVPIDATGSQILKDVFARLLRAFPDLHVTIEDLISEGDKVVSRNTVTGTNLGDYIGHPGTGASVGGRDYCRSIRMWSANGSSYALPLVRRPAS